MKRTLALSAVLVLILAGMLRRRRRDDWEDEWFRDAIEADYV